MAGLWRQALGALRSRAAAIKPEPLNLTVFGSFASGTARRDSDVDLLAVHDAGAVGGGVHADLWVATMGEFVDVARRIAGNPVNPVDLDLEEVLVLGTPAAPAMIAVVASTGGPIGSLR